MTADAIYIDLDINRRLNGPWDAEAKVTCVCNGKRWRSTVLEFTGLNKSGWDAMEPISQTYAISDVWELVQSEARSTEQLTIGGLSHD